MAKLQLVQDPAADALLESNPFALLVGMLLDQQIPLEVAFAGPKKIADRIGGVDAREIADYDPEKFAALCSERPAVHRFPGSMAKRIQALAQIMSTAMAVTPPRYGLRATRTARRCCSG